MYCTVNHACPSTENSAEQKQWSLLRGGCTFLACNENVSTCARLSVLRRHMPPAMTFHTPPITMFHAPAMSIVAPLVQARPVMVATTTLILQAGRSRRSEDIGLLPIATACTILESCSLADGTRRLFCQSLAADRTSGWIDSRRTDGEHALQYQSDGSSALFVDTGKPAWRTYLHIGGEFIVSQDEVPQALLLQEGTSTAGRAVSDSFKTWHHVHEVEDASTQSEQVNIRSAAELHELAEEHLMAAAALEEELNRQVNGLAQRLGSVLLGRRVKELIASWTELDSRAISKFEFRKHVRKLLVNRVDPAEIDTLFDSTDTNADGSLDKEECVRAFKHMQDRAKSFEEWAMETRQAVERHRSCANGAAIAERKIAELEAADSRLLEMTTRRRTAITTRIGGLMLAKSIRIGDVVHAWEKTKGEMNDEQFTRNLRTLVEPHVATDEELKQLFRQIDTDQNGLLDEQELKMAFSSMRQESRDISQQEASLRGEREAVWQAALDAFTELEKLEAEATPHP